MSIFTKEVSSLFVKAYKDTSAAILGAEKAYGANRAFLDAAYLEAAGTGSVTEESMKQVRSAILMALQERQDWPVDYVSQKKVGYQKGMNELNAMPCKVYNSLQAQIGLDLKKSKEQDELAKKIEQPETATPVDKAEQALQNFLNCFSNKEAAVLYFTTHVIEG